MDFFADISIFLCMKYTPAVWSASIWLQVDPLVYQSPCFLGTGLSREQRSTLQKCASKLQARVVDGFCPEGREQLLCCKSLWHCCFQLEMYCILHMYVRICEDFYTSDISLNTSITHIVSILIG